MIPRLLLALLLALSALPALARDAATSGSSAYVIGGIAVDTAGKTTYEARLTAYRVARARAWPILWSRLTGMGEAAAPRLGDGALGQMVAAIEIEGEQFSTTRYIATLGVVFDRARAGRALAGTAGALHSGPMLLLPVFTDGGARTLYQAKTPWLAAWTRFSDSLSPIDYVIASGAAGDNILLTSYQLQRADRPLWRNILNRFGTTDVLIAEVRLNRAWPGGPVAAEFIARHGPDATELGRFTLTSTAEDGLDAMLDSGVQRVDALYTQALRDGRLRSDPSLSVEMEPLIASGAMIGGGGGAATAAMGIEAEVETLDAGSWAAIEATVRGTPTVTAVNIVSLSLGGTSRIVIRHGDTREMLLYQLDQRGLRLVPRAAGLLLRRRLPGDVPVPAPVVASDPTETLPGLPGAPSAPRAEAPTATLPPAPPRPRGGEPADLLPPPARPQP